MIPKGRVYHMTDLIAEAIKAGERVVPFLIHERWIDVGTPKDLERAEALAAELARRAEDDRKQASDRRV
jgi:NDP-sugar pyrophosphorylase family protein